MIKEMKIMKIMFLDHTSSFATPTSLSSGGIQSIVVHLQLFCAFAAHFLWAL